MNSLPDFDRKSHQWKCNESDLIIGSDLALPHNVTREQIVDSMFFASHRNPVFKKYPALKLQYDLIGSELLQFRRTMAEFLQRIAKDPATFSVDVQRRDTQREALLAFASRLQEGLHHPAFEIPTGVGKSMLIGAYLRAYFEVCKERGILDEVEVLLLTSRSNLVTQLMGNAEKTKHAKRENYTTTSRAFSLPDAENDWMEFERYSGSRLDNDDQYHGLDPFDERLCGESECASDEDREMWDSDVDAFDLALIDTLFGESDLGNL